MNQTGEFIIHIEGKYGNEKLSLSNYDISQLKELLGYVEDLVYSDKKKDRPIVTLEQRNGSVINVFKTTTQRAKEIAVVLSMLGTSYTLDALEPNTAKAFENIQHYAAKYDYSMNLSTSEDHFTLNISKNTVFKKNDDLWVDAEVYYYGTLIDAGGKSKSNIHIDIGQGQKTLTIDSDKDYLTKMKENPLYKKYGVRAIAKQNVATGVIDASTLKLVELIGYDPVFDKEYIDSLIARSTPVWKGVDAENYVHSIREARR